MNKKQKQALKSAFISPPPPKKDKFLLNLGYPKITNLEFFNSQIHYIRKRFWFLSALVVVAMAFTVKKFNMQINTVGIFSAFLPILVLLSVMEISKSASYNMAEMEMCCRYSLSKITLIRLTLVGTFNFIILLVMVLLFGNKSEYGFLAFTLYNVTPFLLCSYLSLFITNHLKIAESTYVCGGVSALLSGAILILSANKNISKIIYSQEYVFLWTVILIFIIILLCAELKNLIKRMGDFEWNSQLIA